MNKCRCFAALHFFYDFDRRTQYLAKVQPIVDSLRANNKDKITIAGNGQTRCWNQWPIQVASSTKSSVNGC